MHPETVRRAVSKTYSYPSSLNGTARLAGYSQSQLESVPETATNSFFGCGNPLAFASVREGQCIVDLGSGAGLDAIIAGRAVGPTGRVIGVDMTDAMIQRARDSIDRAGLSNVEIRRGLIEELPIEDGSADWVISNCVISLSPEKNRVFSEIARVLRPGGQMLITDLVVDPQLSWLLDRVRGIAPSIGYARTEAVYLAAMRQAGLAECVVEDRLVYEPSQMIGLFTDAKPGKSSTCAVYTLTDRLKESAVGRGAIKLTAHATAGHIWSAKFRARRPEKVQPVK